MLALTNEEKIYIINKITNGRNRSSLFHYTDSRNLDSIIHSDELVSCYTVDQTLSLERRSTAAEKTYRNKVYIANDQLSIPSSAFALGVTPEDFRKFLDQHVFFWPTKKDCLAMVNSYRNRQPNKGAVVLKFQAQSLLLDNFDRVKLSKYNSGSAPLYPNACTYKKSVNMFVSAEDFGQSTRTDVPKTASEVKEILVKKTVINLSNYIEVVYSERIDDVPDSKQHLWKSIDELG